MISTRAIKTATIFMNLAAACLLIVLGIIIMSMSFRTQNIIYLEKKSPKVKAKLKIDVKSRERRRKKQKMQAFQQVSSDEGVARKEENPSSLLKIICGIFGKKFPPSSWELIQSAMQKIQMKLYPPNLESNSDKNNKDREGGEDKGEKVKEAATRSLEVSKEAIEESAKLAGGVVGEVVHKTAEKVTKQSSHDEM
ncbi:hypothetical protein HID58_007759 [Brassica napus]|uniref:Uncharacterized protein n=1 Tax=Brassica napus TaxID=3708 RepID=A0ABQ8EHR4_BRANA|nr:hypothetical protein HID58_091895 [Brassica napus]KAH0940298.1 hypothetical protein HID58_007759 [Brassica napus]